MAIEDQVVAVSLAGQPGRHVEPLGGQGILPRLEAVPAQPVVHVLARHTLAARRAIDVAERKREIDHLLAVDPLNHIIRGHLLSSPPGSRIAGSISPSPCRIPMAPRCLDSLYMTKKLSTGTIRGRRPTSTNLSICRCARRRSVSVNVKSMCG